MRSSPRRGSRSGRRPRLDELSQGIGRNSSELLARARQLLQQLSRSSTCSAANGMTPGCSSRTSALTYLNEGSYPECVSCFCRPSSRLFGSIHETPRRAQAWQNRALCLWGLGPAAGGPALVRARAHRHRSGTLSELCYLAVMTNTALADYALGHFDESLRLYDRALAFSQKVQSARDEAYCLYGIGVNYYALGDRQRAREFLERSLAIRTVALDGRGRMASLRALATIDAEQGRVQAGPGVRSGSARSGDRPLGNRAHQDSTGRPHRRRRPPRGGKGAAR